MKTSLNVASAFYGISMLPSLYFLLSIHYIATRVLTSKVEFAFYSMFKETNEDCKQGIKKKKNNKLISIFQASQPRLSGSDYLALLNSLLWYPSPLSLFPVF